MYVCVCECFVALSVIASEYKLLSSSLELSTQLVWSIVQLVGLNVRLGEEEEGRTLDRKRHLRREAGNDNYSMY